VLFKDFAFDAVASQALEGMFRKKVFGCIGYLKVLIFVL
jgi:hypothetical protein